jgi:hypothetical protein
MIEKICCAVLTGCAAFFLVTLGFLSLELRKATIEVKSDLHAEALKADAVLTDASRTLVVIGVTAANIEKGTRQFQTQQNQLARSATSATKELNSDLVTLGQLLSTANSAFAEQWVWLTTYEKAATTSWNLMGKPILQNLQSTTENAAKASQALNAGILESMPAIVSTSKSTAQTTANVADTTADVKSFVHRETTPVRGTWNLIKNFLLQFAAPIATVVTSAK